LPQCYDEFMIQNELPCLIDGCDWVGKHLSVHVNEAHGIKAEDFKRAAGFNLSTGLVGLELHERLVERAIQIDQLIPFWDVSFPDRKISSYYSKEGREHHKKAMALLGNGPQRNCHGCGKVFRQSTPCGHAKYCTIECRTISYAAENARKAKSRQRDSLGRFR